MVLQLTSTSVRKDLVNSLVSKATHWKALNMLRVCAGEYPGGGGGSETLILAPWSKDEEWRPHPCRQFGAP